MIESLDETLRSRLCALDARLFHGQCIRIRLTPLLDPLGDLDGTNAWLREEVIDLLEGKSCGLGIAEIHQGHEGEVGAHEDEVGLSIAGG